MVEDGAPVHTAKLVKNRRIAAEVPTQFHPPASPDLNPIENCWAVLKKHLHDLPRHPTTADELWQEVQRLWGDMDQKIMDHAIESMPRRREDLRKAKGGPIRL